MIILLLLLSSGVAIGDSGFTTGHDTQSSPRTPFQQTYPSCFTEKYTWGTDESVDILSAIESLYSCQQLCLESKSCDQFTWYNEQAFPFNFACVLYANPTTKYSCSNCVSGPKSCTCSGCYSCQYTEDNFVGEFPHVDTEIFCQDHCFHTDQCHFYSWFEEDDFPNLCIMFSSCNEKGFNCDTCHSGPVDCANVSIITTTTTASPTPIPTMSSTTKPYLSCFDEDTTWTADDVASTFPNVEGELSCQELCNNRSQTCSDFTFYTNDAEPLNNMCFLFLDPSTPIPCSQCVSGPSSCLCGAEFGCETDGDNLLDMVTSIPSEELCQEQCVQLSTCNFFTYLDESSHPFKETCYLFSSCDKVDFFCEGCSSGPDDCRNISYITTLHPTTPPTTTTVTPTTTTPFVSTTTLHPYTSCFSFGISYPKSEMIVPPLAASDAYSCQHQCSNSSICTKFTFYPHNKVCLLFDHPTSVSDDSLACWSGPKFCTCSFHGSCLNEGDNLIDIIEDSQEEEWCRQLCYQNVFCSHYTWFDMTATITKNSCFLFSNCDEVDPACKGCHTGTPTLPPTPTPQERGDWFCLPSLEVPTCHLECHPGYVSDNGTVINCLAGEWTSSPTCVPAIALIAGRNSPSPYNTAEIYANGLHKKMPNLPNDREFHSLQLVDSSIILCGGHYTKTSCLVFTDSQEWLPHSTTKLPRDFHSSVSMLGKLHLLSGRDSSSELTTEYLTPPSTTWTQDWNMFESIDGACAAKIGPEMFILSGGLDHKSSAISYNVTSGVAIRLQNLIEGRYGLGCCYVLDNESNFKGVLVAGGTCGTCSEMYDIRVGEWSTTGELTVSRIEGVRLIVLGDSIFALGGGGHSSVDKFNMTTRTWSSAEEMLEGRGWHAVTGVPPAAVGIGQY